MKLELSYFFKQKLPLIALLVAVIGILLLLNFIARDDVQASRKNYDRQSLYQFFEAGSFDNDLLLDTFLLPANQQHEKLINMQLLNLRRDRLAYLAKKNGEVVAVAVPATADDGFNGSIDLLVAVDMYGRISAARVIKDLDSDELYGVVELVESQWMKAFEGSSMRDILRISWQKISADNEYDKFVGASITPKTVSDRIYDALVFFNSNRIALMAGDGG
jgi:Na+-translocating ferredoxin:NAD+ oxidoreductase subunit G